MNVRAYIALTDYDKVLKLLKQEKWKAFYEEKKDLYCEALKNSETFICEEDGKVLGFMRLISDFTYTTYVCEIIIDEEYKEKGVGRMLLEKAERLAPYGSTECISDCDAFYEAVGYTKVGSGMRKYSTR